MEERAERLALYILENRATVRSAAQKFGISKSSVHKDLSERLPTFNRTLYLQVKEVLDLVYNAETYYQVKKVPGVIRSVLIPLAFSSLDMDTSSPVFTWITYHMMPVPPVLLPSFYCI